MIPIYKPTDPPSTLRDRGAQLTAELCHLADDGQHAAMRFDRSVYGSPEVKTSLRSAQHDKCCFCESKITHIAFGDVEHFRPKAAVRQSREESERKPGYYWLAYDWQNLYLACERCNRRYKHSLFPLQDDKRRIRSHQDARSLDQEEPLFVDPGREDPADHIGFRRAFASPVGGSPRGALTIDNLGLNRAPLREERQERRMVILGLLRGIRIWIAHGCSDNLRSDAEAMASRVLSFMHDEAKYSAMARAVLKNAMPRHDTAVLTDPPMFLATLEHHAERGRWLRIPPC